MVWKRSESLGTEYNVTAEMLTEIIIYLEIQRGKHGMMNPRLFAEYSNDIGPMASCTKIVSKHNKRHLPNQRSSVIHSIFSVL